MLAGRADRNRELAIREMLNKDEAGGGNQELFLDFSDSGVLEGTQQETQYCPVLGREGTDVEPGVVSNAVHERAPGTEDKKCP
jgi:hypothetical protein